MVVYTSKPRFSNTLSNQPPSHSVLTEKISWDSFSNCVRVTSQTTTGGRDGPKTRVDLVPVPLVTSGTGWPPTQTLTISPRTVKCTATLGTQRSRVVPFPRTGDGIPNGE